MINIKLALFIAIIMLIILVIIGISLSKNNIVEKFNHQYKWFRPSCKYLINKTLNIIFDDNNIVYDDYDWDIYVPCSYDNIIEEINLIESEKIFGKFVFLVNNIDVMIGKNLLWNYIYNYYGEDATKIMPKTYLLNKDINKFRNEYDPDNIYILKKNIQRQEGLKITNSIFDIVSAYDDGYVIVQKMLQDPYTISGHKINLRVYVLVVCSKNNINVFYFNDGFLYYAPKVYIENSIDFDVNVTTGYIDRSIYENNPLTHSDLHIYLDNHDRYLNNAELNIINTGTELSSHLINNIHKLLENTFVPFVNVIGGGKLFDAISFQLLGVDVAVNSDLSVHLMEINKGPDMGFKDERDGKVKYKCMNDIFGIIGVIDNNNTGFVKII